jgi:hypothetical protein
MLRFGRNRGASSDRGGRISRLVLLASAVAVGGCDFPTELPKWNATYRVPTDGTTLSVAQLLPGSVVLLGDRTAFLLLLGPASFARTLGEICPTCAPLNGLLAPKPAFTATVAGSINLPADVSSVALVGGTVTVGVYNNLGFDPIRPSANASAQRGSMSIAITAGGVSLGSATVSGADTAFPSGSTLTRPIALSGASVTGAIAVTVTVNSPAGDPIVVRSNGQLAVNAAPANVRASTARVTFSRRPVGVTDVRLGLEGVGEPVRSRIQGGAMILAVTNPFGVTGSLALTISGSNPTPVTKQLSLNGQPTQTVRVEFTREELRSFVGITGAVTMMVSGMVNGPAAGVDVWPAQAINLAAQLELVLSATVEN